MIAHAAVSPREYALCEATRAGEDFENSGMKAVYNSNICAGPSELSEDKARRWAARIFIIVMFAMVLPCHGIEGPST